ncbi:MAG: hypothetical protein UHU21_08745 [Lachnospiraceae bacterium]|nr:hypothetical protein [Lachnospiraceae bacterium]
MIKYQSQINYDKQYTKQIKLKLNRKTDKDVLDKLDSVESKQTYIKQLIRADIEKSKQ